MIAKQALTNRVKKMNLMEIVAKHTMYTPVLRITIMTLKKIMSERLNNIKTAKKSEILTRKAGRI